MKIDLQKSGHLPIKPMIPRFFQWIAQFQFVTGAIFGIALAIISAAFWTREQARQAVLEPTFVEQLSRIVRPFMIIDSHRTIVADYGASVLINDLKVDVNKNGYEFKITISFKMPMANAPLIRSLTPGVYYDHAERGQMNDWIVVMKMGNETVVNEKNSPLIMLYSIDENKRYQFLVEPLH